MSGVCSPRPRREDHHPGAARLREELDRFLAAEGAEPDGGSSRGRPWRCPEQVALAGTGMGPEKNDHSLG
ncbi:MAG: hypothetical protein OZSIB_1945 [Candidatus Ozemobacter sibiricus]|uniref:Uncharacterized protein n=1 Tax=Candidatus Ozemobacter sibiricus TaxID=2268124 RepID=A0A367ZJ79_9BACT|nr:MAG: hypothetical protein OZSIB_1945 [Candidatus Ozemobacter sibiricus]